MVELCVLCAFASGNHFSLGFWLPFALSQKVFLGCAASARAKFHLVIVFDVIQKRQDIMWILQLIKGIEVCKGAMWSTKLLAASGAFFVRVSAHLSSKGISVAQFCLFHLAHFLSGLWKDGKEMIAFRNLVGIGANEESAFSCLFDCFLVLEWG